MMGLSDTALAHSTLTMCATVTMHCRTYLAAHDPLLFSIVPGVLLPLIFTRVGSSVRSATENRAPNRPIDAARSSALDETLDAQAAWELRRTNLRLASELKELRAAYAQLMGEVAEHAAATDRLNFLAYHDVLTGLPNRALLLDRLDAALAAAQGNGTGVLVMYLDIDHFKQINDTLGHAAGDRVLRAVASRITASIGAGDTASRVGGDEFVIVCATGPGAPERARIEARLLRAIAAPIEIDGTPITVGASLGMSLASEQSDPVALIDNADKAMYSARKVCRR